MSSDNRMDPQIGGQFKGRLTVHDLLFSWHVKVPPSTTGVGHFGCRLVGTLCCRATVDKKYPIAAYQVTGSTQPLWRDNREIAPFEKGDSPRIWKFPTSER